MGGHRHKTEVFFRHTPYAIRHTSCRGITTLMVIAFMGIFLLIMGTITSYAFEQAKYGRALLGREQALHAAESGLEYYRWFLAHNPNNLTNGTGGAGPYTYTVKDPETGTTIGSAAISVAGNTECGQIQSIDITSIGTSNQNPGFPRTLFARYMQQSVAAYSYLLNSNVWAGASRNITGQYFSNGGIRMDGTNNSTVASAVSTWSCTSSYGCSPTATQNGVFGAGSGSALWTYPAASINFAGIGTNLANLKTYAQSNGGLYFATSTGALNSRGYHLVFKSNGTVDVYRVTATYSVPSFSNSPIQGAEAGQDARSGGWTLNEYSIIAAQTLLGNYTIPSSCSLIFLEDRAWIEGVVKGKVTVAVADETNLSNIPDAYLLNNITYATNDGTSGLTVISEGNVLLPINTPSTMTIHGIFVAQGGSYARNLYVNNNGAYGAYSVGYATSTWNSYILDNQLTTEGSVVSNGQTGTSWTSGGVVVSGYQTRIDAYDQLQATNPPPFTPAASTDYGFVLWREQ